MDKNKKPDRLSIIRRVAMIAFGIILLRLVYMTTFQYEYYNTLAENKTYKELAISAPRGEIRDRYGRLLAGNKNIFTVQISADAINKGNSNGDLTTNDISLNLINILENNEEEFEDEFPIYIENGKYYYIYDENIINYKMGNKSEEDEEAEDSIPLDLDAKQTFYYIVDKLIYEGTLDAEDRELEPAELQKKLHENGIYPPILVSSWMFTEEKNKNDWLASYRIQDENVSAKEAFDAIREYYDIDADLSDEEARKIMIVRDLIKSQGYVRYTPITIATEISPETIAQIEESAMELPGVSVAVEPIRYYPEGSTASHILGYIGTMSASEEEELLNKDSGKQYSKGDEVGKTGIEKSFEEQLKGIDGYQRVQVDVLGRITQELEVKEPQAGDTVYLSIDKELQIATENILRDVISTAQTGGTYVSEFGNVTISDAAPNAQSGAIIAIDPKTGDVLSMASYPDYDPNLFVNGISSEDYNNLLPENQNDLLAPSALTNLATHGVFQPGSTFKMITGMAAIDNGISPNYTINDKGVIYFGDTTFANYSWNRYRRGNGYVDLYKAIEVSSNIYFYTIASGDNRYGADPDPSIDVDVVLDYARLFGLSEDTGLRSEIGERRGTVPSAESKLETSKALLRQDMDERMEDAFSDITKEDDPEEFDARIEEITSWADEEVIPNRGEVFNRLAEMNVMEYDEDGVSVRGTLADIIYHTHLKYSRWTDPDIANLAIGQGENQYTPAQIVRYVAAIANGGYLVDLSVVDRVISNDYQSIDIDENAKEEIAFNDSDNLRHLTKGMVQMASDGTTMFNNFPVTVAAKTGTAERSGKIPATDEVEYLENNIGRFGVSWDEVEELAEELIQAEEEKRTKAREREIESLLEEGDLEEEEILELEQELEEGVEVTIDRSANKTYAYYLRLAIKKLNPTITDEIIDQNKQDYDSFAWSVAFAPADDPQIAVVSMIPQGKSSSNALLAAREVMGAYFTMYDGNLANDDEDEIDMTNNGYINFGAMMKN